MISYVYIMRISLPPSSSFSIMVPPLTTAVYLLPLPLALLSVTGLEAVSNTSSCNIYPPESSFLSLSLSLSLSLLFAEGSLPYYSAHSSSSDVTDQVCVVKSLSSLGTKDSDIVMLFFVDLSDLCVCVVNLGMCLLHTIWF